MKTNQELLDFYGVELGKKYKITDGKTHSPNTEVFYEIGDTFSVRVYIGKAKVYFESAGFFSLSILDDISYEEVKDILTDEEKDYLKTVIKPFRDRIQRIYKTEAGNFYEGGEVLFFELKLNDYFYLPELPLNKMFSGMEQGKKYTLEELGL